MIENIRLLMCCANVLMWCSLFVPHPLNHLLDAWLFAVHQDADAVNACAAPDKEQRRGVENDERKYLLPKWYVEGYAHHHDDGRGKGE